MVKNVMSQTITHLTPVIFSEKTYLYAKCITLLLFLSLPFTRFLGGLNLVAITGLAWVFLIFHWDRRFIPTSLIYFTLIANFYVLLSFFHVFPSIWTTEFEIKAIPQQSLFAYSLLPMFYLFFVTMVYFLHSEARLKGLLKYIFILVFYHKVVDVVFDGFDPEFFFGIAGLGNTSALLILGFSILIFNEKSMLLRILYILLFILMSYFSPFGQNIVYAALFILVFIVPRHAFTILSGFIFSTVSFYIIFINDPLAVSFIDQNLTVRLVLIKDAIDGFFQSNLIGVGFGTESIKNYYHLFKNPTFFNQDNSGFIHLAAHNSYATIAYRLGGLGILLFLYFLYQIVNSIRVMKNNQPMAVVIFLCFYVVTYQNPALESFIYLIGTFLLLGVIWALNIVESIKEST